MLKKIVIYLSICSFFWSHCLYATVVEIFPDDCGYYPIHMARCVAPDSEVRLVHGEKVVARILTSDHNVRFFGVDEFNFRLMDELQGRSLVWASGGALDVREPMELEHFALFNVPGQTIFRQALTVCDPKAGHLQFMGGSVEALSSISSKNVLLNKLKTFKVGSKASFKVGDIVSVLSNMENFGNFEADNFQSSGGNWSNKRGALLKVHKIFRGQFDDYTDIGSTIVEDLAYVEAYKGTLGGKFTGANAVFTNEGDLTATREASFDVSNHLSFRSIKQSIFFSADYTDLGIASVPSKLPKGLFFKAEKDIRHKGWIVPNKTGVHFSAGGTFNDAGSYTQSGYFDENNISLQAEMAQLAGHMFTTQNMVLDTVYAQLMGDRDIGQTFQLNVAKGLVQQDGDRTKAGVVLGIARDATLGGIFELAQEMHLKLKYLKTLSSSVVKGGTVGLEADSIHFDGTLQDNPSVKAHAKGDINFGENHRMECVETHHFEGQNIHHVTGSQVGSNGVGTEKAREDISTEVGSKITGGTILLEAGNKQKLLGDIGVELALLKAGLWVDQRGNIKVSTSYGVDTAFYTNWFGGNVNADMVSINSDYFSLNFLGNQSARVMEINSALNLNLLGRNAGSTSLTVNALANGSFLALNQSNHYTSNALLNFSELGAFGFAVPSLDGPWIDSGKAFYDQSLFRSGFGLAANLATGILGGSASAVQLALGAKDTVFSGIDYARTLYTEGIDPHRMSSVMKTAGGGLGVGMSAYQTARGVHGLYTDPMPTISRNDQIKNALIGLAPGSVTDNALWAYHSKRTLNATGHLTRRNLRNYDGSHTLAASKTTTTGTGYETGYDLTGRSVSSASGDYHVGGKKITDSYRVEAGGDLDVEDGMGLTAKTSYLKGKNIQDVQDLHGQRGRYRNFSISDSNTVHTTGLVQYTADTASPADHFHLYTDEIAVGPGIKVTAPGVLTHNAQKGDYTVGAGSVVGSGLFTDIYAAKDVIGLHQLDYQMHDSKDQMHDEGSYARKVDPKVASFFGGSGVEYTYIDPTGEQSTRKIGLRIQADGQVRGHAMQFNSGSDLQITGKEGVYNDALPLKDSKGDDILVLTEFEGSESQGKKSYRYQLQSYHLAGSYTADGKVQVLAPEGEIDLVAPTIKGADGTDLVARDDIRLQEIVGTAGTRVVEKRWYRPNRDTHHKSLQNFSHSTTIENPGEGKLQLFSLKGDVKAPGLVYNGQKGTLVGRGRNLTLSSAILDQQSTYSRYDRQFDWSLGDQFKGLTALQAAKDTLQTLQTEGPPRGILQGLAPNATAGIDMAWIRSQQQTLGQGKINTHHLDLDFDRIDIRNGYQIKASGDGSVHAKELLMQGAKLHYKTTRDAGGVFASGNAATAEASAGVRFSHSSTKGYKWIPSVLEIQGKTDLAIDNMFLDAGIVRTGETHGYINSVDARTQQDFEKTKGWNASLGFTSHGGFSGSAGINLGTETRKANHVAGLFVGEAGSDFRVGQADLHGAEFKITKNKGAEIGLVTYDSLPKELNRQGFSFGATFNLNKVFEPSKATTCNGSMSSTYTSGDRSIGVTFDPKALMHPTKKQEGQLFQSVGTINFKRKGMTFAAPIAVGLNHEAWDQFGRSLVKAGDSVRSLLPKPEPVVVESTDTHKEPSPKTGVDESIAFDPKELSSAAPQSTNSSCDGDLPSMPNPDSGLAGSPSLTGMPDVAPSPAPSDPSSNRSFMIDDPLQLGLPSEFFPPSRMKNFGEVDPETQSSDSLLTPIISALHCNVWFGTRTASAGSPPYYPITTRPFTAPISGAASLEALYEPLVFNGYGSTHSFNHRLTGTNFYVEDPSLLNLARSARNTLAVTSSTYGQKAFAALNDRGVAVLLFNSETTPYHGDTGNCFKYGKFNGLGAHGPHGTQHLNGYCIGVGALGNDPNAPPYISLAHEANGHLKPALKNGNYTPGYVPNNPQLTHVNMAKLLDAYATDARLLGFKSFSSLSPFAYITAPNELYTMYQVPWQYFEKTFKENLLAESIYLPEVQVNAILKNVEHELINGVSPSSKYFNKPSFVTDGLGRSLIEAEKSICGEIPAYFTEADLSFTEADLSFTEADPSLNGLVELFSPNAHKYLETLDCKPSISGQLPLDSGVKPHPVNPGKLPFLQRPTTTKIMMFGRKFWICTSPTLPLLDAGLHYAAERWQGFDQHQSLVRGTQKWAIDTGVYGSVFTGLTLIGGGPLMWSGMGLILASEFIPEYDKVSEMGTIKQARAKINANLESDHFDADQFMRDCEKLDQARSHIMWASIKSTLTTPRRTSEFLQHELNDKFPNVIPTVSTFLYKKALNRQNNRQWCQNNRNKLLRLFDINRQDGILMPPETIEWAAGIYRDIISLRMDLERLGREMKEKFKELDN